MSEENPSDRLEQLTPAEQIARWADELRGIGANGFRFATNIYDKDNYTRLQRIAKSMLGLISREPLATLEPLLGPLFSRPGPIPTADAAIINSEGRMLLIRRADNRLWAMPGGGIDVSETAAQAAVREALEETGVHCEAVQLLAIHDSRLCGSRNRQQLYMISFLCRPLPVPVESPSHAAEVLETAWFSESELPADLDPGHATRIPLAFRAWEGETRTFFDR